MKTSFQCWCFIKSDLPLSALYINSLRLLKILRTQQWRFLFQLYSIVWLRGPINGPISKLSPVYTTYITAIMQIIISTQIRWLILAQILGANTQIWIIRPWAWIQPIPFRPKGASFDQSTCVNVLQRYIVLYHPTFKNEMHRLLYQMVLFFIRSKMVLSTFSYLRKIPIVYSGRSSLRRNGSPVMEVVKKWGGMHQFKRGMCRTEITREESIRPCHSPISIASDDDGYLLKKRWDLGFVAHQKHTQFSTVSTFLRHGANLQ